MIVVDDARVSPLKFFTLVITSQPVNAAGVIGGQVQFSFTGLTNNPSLVEYVWQIRTNGTDWVNLFETPGYYEGTDTTTLTVKAIDNYLATRVTRDFRCLCLFSGGVPTFTNSASLTIAIFTDWFPYAYALGYALQPAGLVTGAALTPIPTGLTGGLTYLWTYFDGDAGFICSNAAAAAPTFSRAYDTTGVKYARWQCTISDGSHTVTTDPFFIAGSWGDTGAVGSVSFDAGTALSFLITWLTTVFPPDPYVTVTPIVTQLVRRLSPVNLTLDSFTFNPATMQYGFTYVFSNQKPLLAGATEYALFAVQFQNPAGKQIYYFGPNQRGLSIYHQD